MFRCLARASAGSNVREDDRVEKVEIDGFDGSYCLDPDVLRCMVDMVRQAEFGAAAFLQRSGVDEQNMPFRCVHRFLIQQLRNIRQGVE